MKSNQLPVGTNCQLSILRKAAARSSLSYTPSSNSDNKSLTLQMSWKHPVSIQEGQSIAFVLKLYY